MSSKVTSITCDLSCPSISYDPVLVRKAGKLEVRRWKERFQVSTLWMLEQHSPMSFTRRRKIKFKSLNILHVLSCQCLVSSIFSVFIGVNYLFPSLLWVLFKSLAGFPCGLLFPQYFDFHLTPRL
jgi:hypothetical protein